MVVTISNQYGSGALEIAQRVAAVLGYAYVDQQLPVVVAERLRVRPDAVEANEDASPTLGERFLTGLERATPELGAASAAEDFDEEVLRAVQQAVREYAQRGDAVIVGRGAAAILGARSDVLRVFLHAPRDWRVAHVCESTGATRAIAEGELDRVDRARTEYLRQWYGLAFGDSRNYDLCIDVSRFTPTQCVDLIATATR
ncbi:MAG: cytidylate kinase-like family protein [Candidatus Eremiobacteraeota bacterium]|nr:cytidylate kinase-like family protein [Candidatus Eremiobacteraeota bacterium]